MDKKGISRALGRGSGLLQEHLPGDRTLDGPILCAACVWAARRIFDLRRRILGWQAWLDPGPHRARPEGSVRGFFENHHGLAGAFADELEANDRRALRKAFAGLYPVLGIEDPFLQTLFEAEIETGAYRAIAAEFAARARSARDAVRRAPAELWTGLSAVGAELAAHGIHELADREIRRLIAHAVEPAGGPSPAAGTKPRPRPAAASLPR